MIELKPFHCEAKRFFIAIQVYQHIFVIFKPFIKTNNRGLIDIVQNQLNDYPTSCK